MSDYRSSGILMISTLAFMSVESFFIFKRSIPLFRETVN